MNENDTKVKRGGTKPQIAIYQKVASREDEILDVLFELLKSRNDSVAVSAAKTLLNKILPDKRAIEVTGKDGQPLTINVKLDMAGGYIPQLGGIITSSAASSTGSSQVQDPDLAPQSKKDNNSDNGVTPAGTI